MTESKTLDISVQGFSTSYLQELALIPTEPNETDDFQLSVYYQVSIKNADNNLLTKYWITTDNVRNIELTGTGLQSLLLSISDTEGNVWTKTISPDSTNSTISATIDISETPQQTLSTSIAQFNITSAGGGPTDTDKDGVPDTLDDYPNDKNKTTKILYPSGSQVATLAFEDLWPKVGDYDMNDTVLFYKYKIDTNKYNKVVDMTAIFGYTVGGANFHNGFAMQFKNVQSNEFDTVTSYI